MTPKQALKHNEKVTEKMRKLQGEFVYRMRIRVIERLEQGRRNTVEDITTDYMRVEDADTLYADYKSRYPETNKYFILVEPVENIQRTVKVRLPIRTDADRQPPTGMPDPSAEVAFRADKE